MLSSYLVGVVSLVITCLTCLTNTDAFGAARGSTPLEKVIDTQQSSGFHDGKKDRAPTASGLGRQTFIRSVGTAALTLVPSVFGATSARAESTRTSAKDGNLPDLPPDAARSYLQYRVALQTSADYYMFDLQEQMTDVDEWGDVNQLFTAGSARGGQGQPSRIERDFINPMRIVALSMPPDEADRLKDAQLKFEVAVSKIRKATAGVRRELPVEIKSTDIQQAQEGWDAGRMAINEYFVALNDATGLKNELRTIPPGPPGFDQVKAYGRSSRRYFDLTKKTKLCQNRGGPTLSQAWGGLMVSGYLQDSCGIPDMDDYFFQ